MEDRMKRVIFTSFIKGMMSVSSVGKSIINISNINDLYLKTDKEIINDDWKNVGKDLNWAIDYGIRFKGKKYRKRPIGNKRC